MGKLTSRNVGALSTRQISMSANLTLNGVRIVSSFGRNLIFSSASICVHLWLKNFRVRAFAATPTRLQSRLAPLLLGLLSGILITPFALAQSAANFDTQALTPESSAPKQTKLLPKKVSKKTLKDASKDAHQDKDSAPLKTLPSRQVRAEELTPYIEYFSSLFLMRERAADPFGQLQDPDAKPVIKAPVPGAVKRSAPIQATPFADIVRMIVVTTIMPREKRFLIGTRSVKQGDQLPLTFRGKPIRVQITEVSSRQIGFRNLESGETAFRKLDLLPAGMTPGNHRVTAPGMTPDRLDTPIELEAASTAP